MGADDLRDETTVNDRGMATIPASIRRRLDIGAGDTLRWHLTEAGELRVDVIQQRYGAFDDLAAVSMGGDALGTHDHAGGERDPATPEPD